LQKDGKGCFNSYHAGKWKKDLPAEAGSLFNDV